MKKALVIFIALAMVCSVFADEPAAEVKIADFTGDATLTFGIKFDEKTDKGNETVRTGFKNETSAKLKLNLLNKGEKSTTGDGVWGELVIKTKGGTLTGGKPAKFDLEAEVDTAVLHMGPVYMGIKSGDFEYGEDFWYPNALNYKDKDDGTLVRKPAAELGYDQGLVLGYAHKMFKVEGSVRTKKDTVNKALAVVSGALPSEAGKKYYALSIDGIFVEKTGNGTKKVQELFENMHVVPTYYEKAGKETFWTNKYALGLYGEVTPIKDLRIGVGGAYVLGDLTKDAGFGQNPIPQNEDNAKDFTLFAGADYRMNIGEAFLIQPTVTYTLYRNYQWKTYDEGEYDGNTVSMLNAGFRFGFAKSKSASSNSLLYDFFGNNALYTDTRVDKDNGDKELLPGISVVASFDFRENSKEKAMDRNLPLMVTFYFGEIVKGLNVAALFGANVAKDASKVPGNGYAPPANKMYYDSIIAARGLQAGVAASYDIKVGDMTIVPAAGMLWTSGTLKGTNSSKIVANQFKVEAKVDVKGLIKNTTLGLFWDAAVYGNAKSDEVKVGNTTVLQKASYYETKHGLVGIKAKIAF